MLRLWFQRLGPAASSTGALALALALGVGQAQVRADADSDSSDDNNASASAADDSQSERDSDQNRREEERNSERDDRQSRSDDPHHQAALGVVLYENSLDVRRVIPDSPADDAGLRRGDEILSVNGERVTSPEQLVRTIRRAGDDKRVKLNVFRNGEHRTINATLASRDRVFNERDRNQRNRDYDRNDNDRQYSRDREYGNRPYNDSYRMQASRGYRQYSRDPNAYDRRGYEDRIGYANDIDYEQQDYLDRNYGRNRGQQGQYSSQRGGDYNRSGRQGYSRNDDYGYGDNDRDYDANYGRAPEGYREEDDRLARYRRSRRGALGITLDEDARGPVRVNHVYRDGPADEAGVRPGDEIVAVDGQEIRGAEELLRVLAQKQPGQEIALHLDRDGRERTLHATMGRPSEVFASENRGYRTSRAPGRNSGQYENDGYSRDGYQNRRQSNNFDNQDYGRRD